MWARPGLPSYQSNISKMLFGMPGKARLPKTFAREEVFRCGSLLDIFASQQLLVSSHFREPDKRPLRGILLAESVEWIFTRTGPGGNRSLLLFVVDKMVMVTCSGIHPILHLCLSENPLNPLV